MHTILIVKQKILLILVCAVILFAALVGGRWWRDRYGPQNYLEIPEWGVRLRLPKDLRGDISYRRTPYGSQPLVLYSRSLAGKARSCEPDSLALNMSLQRSSNARAAPAFRVGRYRNGAFKRLGNYTFAVYINDTDPHNWCYARAPTAADAVWRQAQRDTSQLYSSLSTLEPYKP